MRKLELRGARAAAPPRPTVSLVGAPPRGADLAFAHEVDDPPVGLHVPSESGFIRRMIERVGPWHSESGFDVPNQPLKKQKPAVGRVSLEPLSGFEPLTC